MSDAYAAAGVDTGQADQGVAALVGVLRGIETGREPLSVPLPGHYASVMRLPGAPGLGIALATDSVGSKVIIAEQLGRFETIGIDCVAMNVNDLVCVGAEPLALLDYMAVEAADPALLRALATGIATGASDAAGSGPDQASGARDVARRAGDHDARAGSDRRAVHESGGNSHVWSRWNFCRSRRRAHSWVKRAGAD